MADDYLWDPTAAPDPEIARLEESLRPIRWEPVPLRDAGLPRGRAWHRRASFAWAAIAAVLVIALGIGVTRVQMRESPQPWSVAARDAHGRAARTPLRVGDVVETDARSTATVIVGTIGRAELGPGSRLRRLDADAREHRLSLERGTMHAVIDAPPRYFLVETPAALAVDLGCVYMITVDERGNGLLAVEEGEVELDAGAVRAAVLAGNSAAIHAGQGPGLPFPTRATAALRRAVAAYDAAPDRPATLDSLLAATDARATITLWHLLQRATPDARARVYERLAALAPPPATVTRDRVLRGESGALQRWRTALEPSWIIEPPLWRRWQTMLRRAR